jgi:hypothetical protein
MNIWEHGITGRRRGRPVTHEEARTSAHRLVNSRFNNPDGARCSIPVRVDDDDVVVLDYISEQMVLAEMTKATTR